MRIIRDAFFAAPLVVVASLGAINLAAVLVMTSEGHAVTAATVLGLAAVVVLCLPPPPGFRARVIAATGLAAGSLLIYALYAHGTAPPRWEHVPIGRDTLSIAAASRSAFIGHASGDVEIVNRATREVHGRPVQLAGPVRDIVAGENGFWALAGRHLYRVHIAKGFRRIRRRRVGPGHDDLVLTPELACALRSDGKVSCYDRASLASRFSVDAGERIAGGAYGSGYLWVADPAADQLVQIDPRRGRVSVRIDSLDGPKFPVVDRGLVWTSHPRMRALSRIDAETGEVLGRRLSLPIAPGRLAASGGYILAALPQADSVAVVESAQGRVLGRAPGLANPDQLSVIGDEVWAIKRGGREVHHMSWTPEQIAEFGWGP